MEWFIKKNATLPVIKVKFSQNGRSDYMKTMSVLSDSEVYFSMVDVETGIPKIVSKKAGFVSKIFVEPNTPTEYYIYYSFTKKDTNKVGRYEGQFMLKNEQGDLIVPIREQLFITVQDSFISDSPCC